VVDDAAHVFLMKAVVRRQSVGIDVASQGATCFCTSGRKVAKLAGLWDVARNQDGLPARAVEQADTEIFQRRPVPFMIALCSAVCGVHDFRRWVGPLARPQRPEAIPWFRATVPKTASFAPCARWCKDLHLAGTPFTPALPSYILQREYVRGIHLDHRLQYVDGQVHPTASSFWPFEALHQGNLRQCRALSTCSAI